MADEKKPESSGLTSAVSITAVLALLANFFIPNQFPFLDDRPPGASLLPQQYEAAQNINTRLWQDPFHGLTADETETGDSQLQIYKDNPIAETDQVTVIAVTLPGSPYQETIESRMRWRYAILSALANQQYKPMDEEHIGYFQASIPIKQEPDKSKPTTKVAFEWWSQDRDKNKGEDKDKKILLLWINESSLHKNPAATLKDILCQTSQANIIINTSLNAPFTTASLDSNASAFTLKVVSNNNESVLKDGNTNPFTCYRTETSGAVFNYAVLGPNSSTLLEDMLKEVKNNNSLGVIHDKPITYYSAAATASDESLLPKNLSKEEVKHKTVQTYLQPSDSNKTKDAITLYRTTSTDAKMMQAMADELPLHQIQKTDTIVVLSEWDTFYGRSIAEAFKSAWANKQNIQDTDQLVKQFSYMRGLDGKLPDTKEKETNSTDKKTETKEPDKSEAKNRIELPEGQSQKDYLRRLSTQIRDLDKTLINQGDSKGITVIGVLGSDVRDKFMILEALRVYFPHKLFFTTDLDAAYYHNSKWPQTHNLLVASAFDLKLRPELQRSIPPFRDSYQTAFFLATQMLVNNITINNDEQLVPEPIVPNQIEEKKTSIKTPSPLLFEIGHNSPILLRTNKDTSETVLFNPKCTWKEVNGECKNTVHPPFVNSLSIFTTKNTALMLLSLPLGVVFLCFISSWFRQGLKSTYSFCIDRPWFTVVTLIVSVFICWEAWKYMTQISLEPFYWLEGVSIWPSQLLRVLVVFFTGGFFYWGHNHIKKEYEKDPLIAILTSYINSTHLQLTSMLLIGDEKSVSASNNRSKNSLILIVTPSRKSPPMSFYDVLFIGNWKTDDKSKVIPGAIWDKYTESLGWDKPATSSQWFWRIIIIVMVFIFTAGLVILLTGIPNIPTRDNNAYNLNILIIVIGILFTLFLTIWVVENARLCHLLIDHLSANPSQWHNKALNWARREKKVSDLCANEWLDIYLVTQLTKIMQPLIWGPIVCIALMILARSPMTDDWDLPLGLDIIFIFMLSYAISAEIFLQRGAQHARKKAINQLTEKISHKRNDGKVNEWVIKLMEVEIERIKDLREGAFQPWYQWPLFQSLGGLSTLWLALQYVAVTLNTGSL
jgi:hypothetical protein